MVDALSTYAGFALMTALAALAQRATGFAFTLVLLGLAGLAGRTALSDAADAASMLTLAQAMLQFRTNGPPRQWRLMLPVLAGSLPGLALGVILLAWISAHALGALQVALGVTVVGCAVMLALRPARRAAVSPPLSFAMVGTLSGLLGGLFASPGPPLVLQMYRQPLDIATIRDCLLLVFAVQAGLRLVLVAATAGVRVEAILLAVWALPALAAVAAWHACRQLPPRTERVRRLAAVLLALIGVALTAKAIA